MSQMKCPVCNEQLLIKRTFDETPVDLCESCGGLWLDKGELNKIAHPIQGDIEFCTEQTGEQTASELLCPHCKKIKLLKAKFIEYSDITLDYCPECDGIWLDKGELDAINAEIDALKTIPESWDHRVMTFLSKLPF